jgi:hypothetical protein
VFALVCHGFTMRGVWFFCLGVVLGVLFRLLGRRLGSFAFGWCWVGIFGCSGGRMFVDKAVVAGWVLFGWV